MEPEMVRTGDDGVTGATSWGTAFKLVILAVLLMPCLVFLMNSQRDPFGFSLWPSSPSSNGAPQLIETGWEDVGLMLAPNGSLWCWGHNKDLETGLLEEPSEVPQRIGTDTDWCQIAGSHGHALALKTDRTLWAWGRNGFGVATQTHNRERVFTPTRISPDTNWTQIAAGAGHCLALKDDGSLWAWGQNDHGQVGDGSTNNQFTITRIGLDNDWNTIAAGAFNSYALKQDGTLWGWGLGPPSAYRKDLRDDDLMPRQIDLVGNVVAISAHLYPLLAIRSDGTLWICGPNSHVTASAFVSNATRTLVQIGKDHDWKAVYAGNNFFLARKSNGSWWVCGGIKDLPRTSPMAPLWLGYSRLSAPRRLPLSFEPRALALGYGNALLLTGNGGLWKLSIHPDDSKSAVAREKLKALGNRAFGFLPGRPQPFNLKAFRLDATPHKIWQLPPEVRLQAKKPEPSL